MVKITPKIVIAITAVFVAVVLVAVAWFVTSGSVNASLDDNELHVNAPMVDYDVNYDNILYVDIVDSFSTGSRTNGFGGTNVSSGTFSNSEFGSYTLAIYNSVEKYIIVKQIDSSVLVFNIGSADSTKAFGQELQNKILLTVY
ncbi:MAG: hypothetical protein LBV63_02585 [Candidatus Methanoplasma sp.]|jgi:hypothetical protein|nr:hypothetical protein [Candidatus Methanoplasma sp.]